jgi:hypothetical protein
MPRETAFSFQLIFQLHREFPLLYLLDVFAIPSLFVGAGVAICGLSSWISFPKGLIRKLQKMRKSSNSPMP